jgi:hypothetical protein
LPDSKADAANAPALQGAIMASWQLTVRSTSPLDDFGLCAQLVRLSPQSNCCLILVETDLPHINLGIMVSTERG